MTKEEKLEEAKRLYKTANSDQRYVLESLFSELKESEDERIRKELIDFLEYYRLNNVLDSKTIFLLTDSVAWLEKQGEQNPADKVEPKFKVGDWIAYNHNPNLPPRKIIQIANEHYIFNNGSFEVKTLEADWHLWTIQDAKDGDVLVGGEQLFLFKRMNTSNSFDAHCNYHFIGYDSLSVYDCSYSIDNIYPATKEQRDLLFKKMKESGYMWDAEKKELKKIEKKFNEWSEEDEKMLKACTELVGSTICANYGEEDGVTIESCRNWLKNWTKEDKERYISCLQRLSTGNPEQSETINSKWFKEYVYPQSQWKPSEEQIKALSYYLKNDIDNDGVFGCQLVKLYQDLKKLREE